MPTIRPEISGMGSVAQSFPSYRDIVGHAVNARRHLGQSEAVYQVGRELGIKPRRVLAVLRGEIARFWSDEVDHARAWWVAECDRQAASLEHQTQIVRARQAAARESIYAVRASLDRREAAGSVDAHGGR